MTFGLVIVVRVEPLAPGLGHRRFSRLELAGDATPHSVVFRDDPPESRPKIPADDLARADAFRNAWGMAMVYTADKDYEEYLTLNLTEELSFVVEEWKKDSGMP